MQYLIILFLLGLMLISVALERYYTSVPSAELRRQKRKGDPRASLVYEVVRNIGLAKFYLNVLALISFAVLAVYVSQRFSLITSVIFIILIVIILRYINGKNKYIKLIGIKLAPHFAWFIVFTRPYAAWVRVIFSWLQINTASGSGIYEKDDLLEILENQKSDKNNRINQEDLDLVIYSLTFTDKQVKDCMTPRSVVRFVRSDEPVSTVLMGELHDSGFSRFPVYMDDKDNIVGTLFLKDLVERRMTGKVFSAMSDEFYTIQEDENLEETLKQFLKTQHHLYVVKNKFGEVVGIITIEDVIEQIMGRKIVDEFDKHEDMREYAEEQAKKE